jgi:dihydroorotate dehydrogenase (fumarate)
MNLKTKYLGMNLKHPLVPSASPLSHDLDSLRRLEDAGASAVVMFSLFEEQLHIESQALHNLLDYGRESVADVTSYWPELPEYASGPDQYLELINKAKETLDIPIIGSLNCNSLGGWVDFARLIEEAGANALELNIYHIPTDPQVSASAQEAQYIEMIKAVRAHTSIPLAVKLHPFFSSLPHTAQQLAEHGANGLVLFNRFYQPDFDLDTLEVAPRLVLSTSDDLRLPLWWTSILYGKIQADLAITSGVHNHLGVLKAMMAGARVAMMASELLRHGIGRIQQILNDLQRWMEEHEYESIQQMQGSMSHQNVRLPEAFERVNYMRVLRSYNEDPTGRSW